MVCLWRNEVKEILETVKTRGSAALALVERQHWFLLIFNTYVLYVLAERNQPTNRK